MRGQGTVKQVLARCTAVNLKQGLPVLSLREVAEIAWQSKSRPAAPTDVERIEAVLRWLRDELHDMKDRDAWRSPPEPALWLRRPARPHVHAVIREKFEGVRFRRL
jgi:hypothetical protein